MVSYSKAECNSKFRAMETAFDEKVEALKKDMEAKYDEHVKRLSRDFDAKVDVMMTMLQAKDTEIGRLNKDLGTLQATSNFLTKETRDLDAKINTNAATIRQANAEVDSVKNKTSDLEDRSRRNNIVFFNIPESEQDNEDCEKLVKDVLRHNKIMDPNPEVDNVWFERAHRIGPITKKREGKQRPIIVRFSYFKQKQSVIQGGSLLKNSPVNMSEDYSRTTIDIHKKLVDAAKAARQANSNIKSFKMLYRRVRVSAQIPGNEKFVSKTFSVADINNDPNWYNFVPMK